jgi:two-component system sensor histidine kinase YesM
LNIPGTRIYIPLFYKMIGLFLVTAIPIYIISLLMNQAGSNSVKQEITGSQMAQVNYYMRALEVEINRITHLQQVYINDVPLQQLSVEAEILSDYEKKEAVDSLQRQLQIIKASSPYIYNVSAYIPLVDSTISTASYYSELDWAEFHRLLDGANKEHPFIYDQGRLFVVLVYPDSFINRPRMPNYILSVELSIKQLTESLELYANHLQGGAVLVGDSWSVTGSGFSISEQLRKQITEEPPEGQTEGYRRENVGKSPYLIAFNKSVLLGVTMFIFVPENEILGPLHTYQLWFWVLSGFSFVIVFIFSYWIYRQIHQPLHKLVRAFRKAEEGDLDASIQVSSHDEFNYLYEQYNMTVRKLKISLLEVVEQSTRAQRSELKQLQAQINPHFLYNSFFILHGLARMDDRQKVVQLSKRLGQYFQYLTRSGTDEVELGKELEHTKAYLEIQAIRFSQRIQIHIDVLPFRYYSWMVPRLILQPIIENAYKYGLENLEVGGLLSLTFNGVDDQLMITIEDNGQELTDVGLSSLHQSLLEADKAAEYTGVINVHRRLQLKYGQRAGLHAARGDTGGMKISMTLINHSRKEGLNDNSV